MAVCITTVLGMQNLAMSYTEYKLGMTCPRSGNQTFVGDMQLAGVEAAIEEINDKGGIDGIPIKLVVEDHQAKPTMAVTALQKLINVNRVPLAFTTYSTTQLAQVPLADRKKMVMINTGASSAELIKSGEYIFHVQPNSASYLKISTHYMCEVLGLKGKRWAILYMNDAMGRSFDRYARSLLPHYGVTEMFSDNWESGGTTDYRPIVSKAMNFKPDAVFLGGYAKENALCLKQLKEAGFTGQVMSAWGGDLLSKEAGKTVMNVYYGEQIVPDNERLRMLKDKLTNTWKLPMFHTQSINAYDAVYMAADAIKYAKDNYGGSYFTGEKLRQAILEKREYSSLSAPGVLDPDTHVVSRQLAVKTFKEEGGKLVEITVKEYTSKEFSALPEGSLK